MAKKNVMDMRLGDFVDEVISSCRPSPETVIKIMKDLMAKSVTEDVEGYVEQTVTDALEKIYEGKDAEVQEAVRVELKKQLLKATPKLVATAVRNVRLMTE